MRIVRAIIFSIYVIIAFILATSVAVVISIFKKDKPEFFHRASQIWFRYFIIPPSGVKVSVIGLSNIPKGEPSIYVSNHQSLLDIPILLAYLPSNLRFIAKKELFSIPFLGSYIAAAGHIKIDREASISAHKTLGRAISLLKEGKSIVIFPEGTRSKEGKLGTFKRGSLMIAFEVGAPVVPIAIRDSFKRMPGGSLIINPGEVLVRIGKPISFRKIKPKRAEYKEALEKLRRIIEDLLERS